MFMHLVGNDNYVLTSICSDYIGLRIKDLLCPVLHKSSKTQVDFHQLQINVNLTFYLEQKTKKKVFHNLLHMTDCETKCYLLYDYNCVILYCTVCFVKLMFYRKTDH